MSRPDPVVDDVEVPDALSEEQARRIAMALGKLPPCLACPSMRYVGGGCVDGLDSNAGERCPHRMTRLLRLREAFAKQREILGDDEAHRAADEATQRVEPDKASLEAATIRALADEVEHQRHQTQAMHRRAQRAEAWLQVVADALESGRRISVTDIPTVEAIRAAEKPTDGQKINVWVRLRAMGRELEAAQAEVERLRAERALMIKAGPWCSACTAPGYCSAIRHCYGTGGSPEEITRAEAEAVYGNRPRIVEEGPDA